jgi:RNA polymerase sigma factor (TIGR02999 family)
LPSRKRRPILHLGPRSCLPGNTRIRAETRHRARPTAGAVAPPTALLRMALAPQTDLLTDIRSGRRDSLDRLLPVVYEELRAIAHRQLAGRGRRGTVTTTALVHEAYLKLVDQSRAGWRDRAHFLALASVAMRHVLVDQAKARAALKRGGGRQSITWDDAEIGVDDQPAALLQLNEALERLAASEPRLARVVECRFFGGLTEQEIAEVLAVTVRTVQRDWAKARMLLRRALAS